MISGNRYAVDIAMMKVAKPPDLLYSLGLGSCVGVALLDPLARIGGLIHILLPSRKEFGEGSHLETKFADSGIAALVKEMVRSGAAQYRMKAKIAGGATMFATASASPATAIGKRNVESCLESLKTLGIELLAQDTGGSRGRTIYFNIATGDLTVKMIDAPARII